MFVPSGADPEDESPGRDDVDRRRHAGEQSGWAKRHRADRRADCYGLRALGRDRERDPTLDGVQVAAPIPRHYTATAPNRCVPRPVGGMTLSAPASTAMS